MSKFSPVLNLDSISPVTQKGDLMVRNASMIQAVPIGTNNNVLTADSTQASGLKWAPTNANVSVSTLTGATTLPATSSYLYISGTTFQIVLPSPSGNGGLQYVIQKIDGHTTTQSIGATNGFGGVTFATIGEQYTITCDGTTYWPGNHITATQWAQYGATYPGAGGPAGASCSAYFRRNGPDFDLMGFVKTGTVTGATAAVTLPAPFTISTAGLTAISTNAYTVGHANNSRTSTVGNVVLAVGGATGVYFSVENSTQNSNVAQLASTIWTSGDTITYFAKVPIAGLGA